jgi:hypothetical protein
MYQVRIPQGVDLEVEAAPLAEVAYDSRVDDLAPGAGGEEPAAGEGYPATVTSSPRRMPVRYHDSSYTVIEYDVILHVTSR